jgi:hypothetical protein
MDQTLTKTSAHKWADYVIFEVRYEGGHIEAVKLRKDLGDKFGPLQEWTRAEVVAAINDDKTFVTIDYGELEKNWLERGEDVSLYTLGDEQYLRTHRGQDNLKGLPEYE